MHSDLVGQTEGRIVIESAFGHPAEEATAFVRRHIAAAGMPPPRWAVILGSGMGEVARRVDPVVRLSYADIPHFRDVAVAGHRGELILGHYAAAPVVVMSGRYHFYEGHPVAAMTLPVSVMANLGADRLVVSNAAGGVNPRYRVGDLVLIDDLICTWRGFGLNVAPEIDAPEGVASDDDPTPMTSPGTRRRGRLLDHRLIVSAQRHAASLGFAMTTGCYHATTGPTYETRAEYRMMRKLGIDLVGMSTAAEVLHAALVCRMRVLALSMVSNVANVDRPSVTSHDEVVDAGRIAAGRVERLMERLVGGE